MKIIIQSGDIKVSAVLNDSRTARKIWDALPITGTVNTWGEEIYFKIPVHYKVEKTFARDVVEVGDLAFWPQGSCFCIFFGLTPNSRPGEIRPASTVNLIGQIEKDAAVFKVIKEGAEIRIEKI